MHNVAKDNKPSSDYTEVYQQGDKFRWQVFHEVKGFRRTKSMSGFESALAAYVSRYDVSRVTKRVRSTLEIIK